VTLGYLNVFDIIRILDEFNLGYSLLISLFFLFCLVFCSGLRVIQLIWLFFFLDHTVVMLHSLCGHVFFNLYSFLIRFLDFGLFVNT